MKKQKVKIQLLPSNQPVNCIIFDFQNKTLFADHFDGEFHMLDFSKFMNLWIWPLTVQPSNISDILVKIAPYCETMLSELKEHDKEWISVLFDRFGLDEIFMPYGVHACLQIEKELINAQAEFIARKDVEQLFEELKYYNFDIDNKNFQIKMGKTVRSICEKNICKNTKKTRGIRNKALWLRRIMDIEVCINYFNIIKEIFDEANKFHISNIPVKLVCSCDTSFIKNFPSSWEDKNDCWLLKTNGKEMKGFLGKNISSYSCAISTIKNILAENNNVKNSLEYGEICFEQFKKDAKLELKFFDNIMKWLMDYYGMLNHVCVYNVLKGVKYLKIRYCLLRIPHIGNTKPRGRILHADGRTNYPACRNSFKQGLQKAIFTYKIVGKGYTKTRKNIKKKGLFSNIEKKYISTVPRKKIKIIPFEPTANPNCVIFDFRKKELFFSRFDGDFHLLDFSKYENRFI